MNNSINLKFTDSLILLFILIVFFAVGFIFYTEIIKNKKIRFARNNFYEVKKEIISNLQKCSNESQNWNFGGSCSDLPKIDNIVNFFNVEQKLVNPYERGLGVNGSPGSVLIKLDNHAIIISIDVDANGGIDIEHLFTLS